MGPTREPLGTGDRSVRKGDDRLVGNRDRVIGERVTQILLESSTFAHRAAYGLLAGHELRAAGGVLGLIDGLVRAANELLRVVLGTRRGDAETRAHANS
jgi:hypothetical protein